MKLSPDTAFNPTLASKLYATSQEIICEGRHQCYWCSAPCDQTHTHKEFQPVGVRNLTALRVSSPYTCKACMAYRRPRSTITFLGGSYKDGQNLANHTWICTKRGVWAVRHDSERDVQALYTLLLDPPRTFALAVRDTPTPNLLQFAVANDRQEAILADTHNAFTIDGHKFRYTSYELEQAARTGETNGTEAGVRELFRVIGPCPKALLPVEEVSEGRGRQKLDDGKITKSVIRPARLAAAEPSLS